MKKKWKGGHIQKYMIKRIIVEGPDCSGKSTVVERIKNMLRWDSKSLHHRKGDQYERYLREYSNNKKIVFDRSHFSEIVYSKLWRGGNPFSFEEENILNEVCKHQTLIIFVCPELKTLEKRYKDREFEQQIKLKELMQSREFFVEIVNGFDVLFYESKNYDELNELLEKVKELVK